MKIHMKPNENEEITRDEIKKEFQLERMILFSDAVFAIVITLMAIEIKIPETEELTSETLGKALFHLLPTLLAYIVSFIFIGSIWYQHLKMFSLLKDYNKGLVIRNMVLLFFIGLFPFSATLITRAKGQMLPFYMYLFMILFCVIAQYVLYRYIVGNPSIRLNTDMAQHIEELHKRKVAVIGFSAAAVLIMITSFAIPQPELKSMSMLWMTAFPIFFKLMTRKKQVKPTKI